MKPRTILHPAFASYKTKYVPLGIKTHLPNAKTEAGADIEGQPISVLSWKISEDEIMAYVENNLTDDSENDTEQSETNDTESTRSSSKRTSQASGATTSIRSSSRSKKSVRISEATNATNDTSEQSDSEEVTRSSNRTSQTSGVNTTIVRSSLRAIDIKAIHAGKLDGLDELIRQYEFDFITLQGIDPTNQDGLFAKIKERLNGKYSAATVNRLSGATLGVEIVDAGHCVTFYNDHKFKFVPTAENEFTHTELNGNAARFTLVGNANVEICIGNMDASHEPDIAKREEAIRTFLLDPRGFTRAFVEDKKTDKKLLTILTGQFPGPAMIATPFNHDQQLLVTSYTMDEQGEREYFANAGAFSATRDRDGVTYHQLMSNHLDPVSGENYSKKLTEVTAFTTPDAPDVNEHIPRKTREELKNHLYINMSVDLSGEKVKIFNDQYTALEYQQKLRDEFDEPTLIAREATTFYNIRGVGITMSEDLYDTFCKQLRFQNKLHAYQLDPETNTVYAHKDATYALMQEFAILKYNYKVETLGRLLADLKQKAQELAAQTLAVQTQANSSQSPQPVGSLAKLGSNAIELQTLLPKLETTQLALFAEQVRHLEQFARVILMSGYLMHDNLTKPAHAILIEHYTEVADRLLQGTAMTPEEGEACKERLERKLFGKPPLNKTILATVVAFFAAVIGAAVGLALGGPPGAIGGGVAGAGAGWFGVELTWNRFFNAKYEKKKEEMLSPKNYAPGVKKEAEEVMVALGAKRGLGR